MSLFGKFFQKLREWPDKDGNDDHGRGDAAAESDRATAAGTSAAHDKAADAHNSVVTRIDNAIKGGASHLGDARQHAAEKNHYHRTMATALEMRKR